MIGRLARAYRAGREAARGGAPAPRGPHGRPGSTRAQFAQGYRDGPRKMREARRYPQLELEIVADAARP